MPFWRRDDEPAHERLAREAGIDLDAETHPPLDPEAPLEPHERIPFLAAFREVGIHGIHRQRTWDAVATADAPELQGDQLEFVALPDGTLLVDDDLPEGALEPVAQALGQELEAPYRARAVRREGDVWAVAGNRIEVLQVPEKIDGDTVSLAVQGGERTLLADERPAWRDVPTLEAFARDRYSDFVLHAERLDGDLWAVQVNPL
ncbi:MAG TPA: hypothetical protein VFG93_00645 [Gaiellaceae bacterium]|jgi:hypothetical protein|nr:hypothetical protein [Gaiellaceae bacterium]